MDPMLERAKRLADDAEADLKKTKETQILLEQKREKQEQNLSNAETLARAGKEVDDQKKEIARSEIKLMLMQPEEVKSFLDNVERQVTRYEKFKANRDAAFAKLPQTEENRKKMESIVQSAENAHSTIPNDDKWKLNTDEAHADQWMKVMLGVKELALSMDAFDTLTGDYSETAKLFIPEANRYASNKKEDAAWKAKIDRKLADNWEKRAAFFTQNRDATQDTEEVKEIRAMLVDAEKIFDANQPTFTKDEMARGATFLAMQRMNDALELYDAYRSSHTETAVASAAPPSAKIESDNVTAERPADIKNRESLTRQEGGVLVSEGESRGAPTMFYITERHPAFDIAANRRDIGRKVSGDQEKGYVWELSETDWKKIGGSKDGSWNRKAVEAEGEPRPELAERPAIPKEQPTQPIAAEQPVAQGKPVPANENPPAQESKPVAEGKKNDAVAQPAQQAVPAEQQPAAQQEVMPAQKPAVAETKPNDAPIAEQKPVVNVPPVKMEQPAVATEKVPEAIKAVLKEDGNINVPTQETIYIAYYLPNGERHRNYVRFPSSEVTRWTIDGMCVAERTAEGWNVRPEAGLTGALLFNVGGTTSIIKLIAKAEGAGLAPSR